MCNCLVMFVHIWPKNGFPCRFSCYVCKIPAAVSRSFLLIIIIIIAYLYIFILIFIVSPNNPGLMLFVCNWCDKKSLSYLILSAVWPFKNVAVLTSSCYTCVSSGFMYTLYGAVYHMYFLLDCSLIAIYMLDEIYSTYKTKLKGPLTSILLK